MTRLRDFLVVLIFLFSGLIANAESGDSLTTDTPFRKDRWTTLMSGHLTSGSLSQASNPFGESFSNNYLFALNGSYFVANRLAVGITLGASRSNFEEYITRESEGFSIGPEITYFMSKNKEGSLYLEYSPYYAKLLDRTVVNDPSLSFDTLLKGKGFGQLFGLGYSYVIRDLAILQIGFRYSYTWFYGSLTDQIIGTESGKNFTNSELSFSFGIGLFLGK